MGKKHLELYLDESGDFSEGKPNRLPSDSPSIVGGLLCDKGWMTEKRIQESFQGKKIHACRIYDKQLFFSLLQGAKNDGCKFVIFENTEKISVINNKITYINIICEGLVHFFRDLAIEYPDGVQLKIIVAQREMDLEEYLIRLKERLAVALARNHIVNKNYELFISDARTDARLNYADIICNTWFTRNHLRKWDGKNKFTEKERSIIKKLYDTQWVYNVFEDISSTMIYQSVEERRLGEAMSRMCAFPKKTRFAKLRERIVRGIELADSYEQDTWFTQISLLLGQYNHLRRYKDGIAIAENYIQHFLNKFTPIDHLKKIVPLWLFDTNYYLLTMYDHIGNVSKCREHLHACSENISTVNRTWEHIDYYFGFRIRELTVLMGCFAFQEVLQRAKKLEKIFIEARDLFGMIADDNGTEQDARSELLGKVYGVELEATINLLHNHPEMYDDAVALSDKAIAEFIDSRDISRQYQYRCLLMVESGKAESAYRMLLQSAEIEENEQSVENFLTKTFALRKGTYDFLLWHYSNVMLLFMDEHHPMGDKMFQALKKNSQFMQDIQDDDKEGHPWNLVLWNVARCARMDGNHALHKQLYRRAMKITREDKMNVTMMTFAISMSAEQLLWCRNNHGKDMEKAEAEFMSVCQEMEKISITDEMKEVFRLSECKNKKSITDELLSDLAHTYLK